MDSDENLPLPESGLIQDWGEKNKKITFELVIAILLVNPLLLNTANKF